MRGVIVGGADIRDYDAMRRRLRPDDYVICCDSGLRHREGLRVTPSLIVGDFDSHERPDTDVETIVLPREKDDTDTVFAVKEALRDGGAVEIGCQSVYRQDVVPAHPCGG